MESRFKSTLRFLRKPMRLRMERLEPRRLLAVTPIISEFMASNDNTLDDGDGRSSDWIEIYNPTDAPVDLAGWHLTDNADLPEKWEFPSTTQSVLDPGDYLLVFASGQDVANYVDPLGYLHTTFRLSAGGEYLGLTDPAGNVVFDFGASYPPQRTDVSYGFSAQSETFLDSANSTSALVPGDGSLDSGSTAPPPWSFPGFDDSAWPGTAGTGGGVGVGYDKSQGGAAGPADGTQLAGLVGNDLTDPDEDGVYEVAFNAGLAGSSPGGEEPVRALDSQVSTKWLAFDPAGTFYEMEFLDGLPRHVDRYTITSANDAIERDPYSWTLSGSNDGVNYTVIDTRTAQDFAQRFETRLYEFANDSTYVHYRFDFETEFGVNGQNQPVAIQMAEIELLSTLQFSYDAYIDLDIESAWDAEQSSVYQRVDFTVDDPEIVDRLTLNMQYEDGFIAYLNGAKIASSNAPLFATWQSNATAQRDDTLAVSPAAFDISEYADLLVAGENVLAIHVLNNIDASSDLLSVPGITATLLECDLSDAVFYTDPSPEAANGVGQEGFTTEVSFSVERGFYDSAFTLEIANTTPGAEIFYTTNGDQPSVENGTLYDGPITIDETTVVKAAAFRDDFFPSPTETHSYFFVRDVVRQDAQWTLDEAGFPTSWGGVTPDYGLDPDVIGNFDANGNSLGGDSFGGVYAETIQDDLKAIPTLSISMDTDTLFGSNGIYTNSTSEGIDWERATSVELIHPDGTDGFQVDAGLRMQGGAFRRHDLSRKHSFRLLFKADYGPTKLDYPFFGPDAVSEFDTITLRMESNDGFAWNAAGADAQYARNSFASRSQAALGQPAAHDNRVHLYLNGVYWGLYNPVERPDASFSASYYGGDKDDWDAISDEKVIDGTGQAWSTLNSLARAVDQASGTVATRAAYQRVLGNNPDGSDNPAFETLLDVDNYVDYLLVNFYVGNQDWPQRNWYASRLRGAESTGFKFHIWDAETAMNLGNNVNTNRLDADFEVAEPYGNLRSSEDFRLKFGDRAHRALFNDGAFTTDFATNRYRQILGEIDEAMVAESARWGDMHGGPHTPADWMEESNSVINTFIRPRANVLLNQLRSAGLYPSVDAPVFNMHGGEVPAGFDLTMSVTEGQIWFTTDGSDPRSADGLPIGTRFTSGVTINNEATVSARTFVNGQWSALNQATFTVAGLVGDFDGDGSYGCFDVNSLSGAIADGSNSLEFDINGDTVVNAADMEEWLAIAGSVNLASGSSYLVGDANLDGVVDVSDFNIWNANKFTTNSEWCSGDFTLDGSVDVSDFNQWNANKFTAASLVFGVNGDSFDSNRTESESSDARRVIDRVFLEM